MDGDGFLHCVSSASEWAQREVTVISSSVTSTTQPKLRSCGKEEWGYFGI